jgi:hypothetical protein
MNRYIKLLIVALLAVAVIFFIQKPDIFDEIWLWLIGLAGPIAAIFKRTFNFLKDEKDDQLSESITTPVELSPPGKRAEIEEIVKDDFKGVTITVLRYSDDGTTTVGLLYLNGFFYCYTLEDTYRDVKVAGQTRIPAGKYNLDFNRYETVLTLKYREKFPDWFHYHLHIKNVPGFTGVYIHSGGDHTHTEGCLLVSDSLSIKNTTKFLTNSRNTFKRLYIYLKEEIDKGTPVRLIVRDEAWFAKLNA